MIDYSTHTEHFHKAEPFTYNYKVIDDAMVSRKLSAYQKDHLRQLKNSILCSSAPPLEPIFGNKTCN